MQRTWRVIGIDAGWKNLAVCVIDYPNILRPVHWELYQIMEAPFAREKFMGAVQDFFEREDIKKWLESADQIVLEKQLQEKYACLNCKVRFGYWEKTTEEHPSSVGKKFGLASDRQTKKKQAVVLAQKNSVFPKSKGKKDDLADAYLLAVFGLHQLQKPIEGWKELDNGTDAGRSVAPKRARGQEPSAPRQQKKTLHEDHRFRPGWAFF
jgi:hypothetical protein